MEAALQHAQQRISDKQQPILTLRKRKRPKRKKEREKLGSS